MLGAGTWLRAAGPLRVGLGRGHEICLPTLCQACMEAQLRNQRMEEPVEKWSLSDSIQYVCNKAEMEKMLI